DRVGAVVRGDRDPALLVVLLDLGPSRGLGDRGEAGRGTGLEQLLHTRQTMGDVAVGAGHTTGVEGTHGQLRAGLTHGLGRDDADGLTHVDQLPGRERTAVALGTGAHRGVTGQHGTDLDRLHAGLDQLLDLHVADLRAGRAASLPAGADRRGGRVWSSRRARDLAVIGRT